jgi:hypothetical protein
MDYNDDSSTDSLDEWLRNNPKHFTTNLGGDAPVIVQRIVRNFFGQMAPTTANQLKMWDS